LYLANEDHKDFQNQNPEVMVARIFNTFPVDVKLIDDKKEFIFNVKQIVYKYQFYDMNEFFTCNFEL